MAKRRSWRDRTTVDGRTWQVRQATDNLVNAMKNEPFRLSDVDIDLVNALRGHRSSLIREAQNSRDLLFTSSTPLDTSMIDDRRGDKWKPRQTPPLAKQIPRGLRKKRPLPPEKPKRPVNQGRHDEATAKNGVPLGAFSGDGRLERPAPRYGQSSRDDYAGGTQAGTSDRPRIQQHAKPKKKPPPRFNQGRHDG